MKMKVINMAMKKVGDDKLRRKVVSFLLVTLMMATTVIIDQLFQFFSATWQIPFI